MLQKHLAQNMSNSRRLTLSFSGLVFMIFLFLGFLKKSILTTTIVNQCTTQGICSFTRGKIEITGVSWRSFRPFLWFLPLQNQKSYQRPSLRSNLKNRKHKSKTKKENTDKNSLLENCGSKQLTCSKLTDINGPFKQDVSIRDVTQNRNYQKR